jgi:hypothetical protein
VVVYVDVIDVGVFFFIVVVVVVVVVVVIVVVFVREIFASVAMT